MYKIILHKNAAKYYRNADKKLQGRISTAVGTISENPRYHVHGLIPKTFAYKFVYIAGLRNFLAHDYQENTIPELEKFLKYGLKDIQHFIKAIDKLL